MTTVQPERASSPGGSDRNGAADQEDQADQLLQTMYGELREIASNLLRRHRSGDRTLQPTALVHELYLRLAGKRNQWSDMAHFRAMATVAMRRILIDNARARKAKRRSGNWQRVTLTDAVSEDPAAQVDLVALDDALSDLARLNSRHAELVQLRFLGGLSTADAGRMLGVSSDVAKRDWRVARAWLMKRLEVGP